MAHCQGRYRHLYIECQQLSASEQEGSVPARCRESIVAEHIQLAKLRGIIPDIVDKAQRAKLIDNEDVDKQMLMDRMSQRDPVAHALLAEQERTRVMAKQIQLLTQSNKPTNQPNRPSPKDKGTAKDNPKDKAKWKPKGGTPLVDSAAKRAGKPPGSHSS
jgi:hypothetical protein